MVGRRQFALCIVVFVLITVIDSANRQSCRRLSKNPATLGEADAGCILICRTECTTGTCDPHDACTCPPGYRNDAANSYPGVFSALSYYSCEPVCKPACQHGHCQLPGRCKCQPGYIIIAPGRNCGRPCNASWDCGPGVCPRDGDGVCQCHEGHVNNGTNHCVAVDSPTPWTTVDAWQGGPQHVTTAAGTYEQRCSTNADCPPSSPTCSSAGHCSFSQPGGHDVCIANCVAGCQRYCTATQCTFPQGQAHERDKPACVQGCQARVCNVDEGVAESWGLEKKWAIVGGGGVGVVVLAVGITAVLCLTRSRRRDGARSNDVAMQDMSRDIMGNAWDLDQEANENSWKRRNKWDSASGTNKGKFRQVAEDNVKSDARKSSSSDGYLEPRGAVHQVYNMAGQEEPPRFATAHMSTKEAMAMARVNPNLFHPVGPTSATARQDSYVDMRDLHEAVGDEPIYLYMVDEQDLYENLPGRRC